MKYAIFFKQFGIASEEGFRMGKQLYFKIPKLIQCSPDYIMINNDMGFKFVECKMADKATGSHVKIKEHDLKYYKQWSSVGDLLFYIHKTNPKESYFVEMCYIEQLFESGELEAGYYPENNKMYYKIDIHHIRSFGRLA